MLLPESWLREWVDTNLSIKEIANILTMIGLEVEHIGSVGPDFSKVVIGRICGIKDHPNADKLRICEVDVGEYQKLTIICGAPNVELNMFVACALVGAILPGNYKIKRAKIRGIESQGMLCSAAELGLEDNSEGIVELQNFGNSDLGTEYRKTFGFDEIVLTVKPTPNRGDCLSVLGVARDLCAASDEIDLVIPEKFISSKENLEYKVNKQSMKHVDKAICGKFSSRVISNVNTTVKTPEWIKRRLEIMGQRSISALVDISNYVMFSIGRPSHIFDLDKIKIDSPALLEVRWANENEKLKLLNGDEIKCTSDLAVIADEAGPLTLAGIMGGERSMVTEKTKNILVEAAFWWPGIIRGRVQKLRLNSEAAYRFERGVDPGSIDGNLEILCSLIVEICGGELGNIYQSDEYFDSNKEVIFRKKRCDMILGFDLSLERMKQIFTNLNMKAVAHQHKEELKVIPPPYRFDIEIEEDLIEEVARIEGFDSIPEHIPVGLLTPKIISSEKKRIDFLRDTLVHDDFNEVITFSFIEEDSAKKFMSPFILNESEVIKVVNPISSSMESMRTSLIPGLLKVLVDNVRNQQDRVRIFEIGRVFFKTVQDLNSQEVSGITQCHLFSGLIFGTSYPEQWSTQKRIVDYFDMKNILNNALREKFIVKTAPKNVNFFHPKKFTLITQLPEKKASKLKGNVAELDVFGAGNVGYFGELHPEITKSLNLSTSPILFEIQLGNLCQEEPAKLQKISKVPIVRRDMSFVLNSDIQIGELSLQISKLVKSSRLGRLLMDFSVCDVYKGADLPGGKQSITFKVIMQDKETTLKESEVESVVQFITKLIKDDFGGRLRV